MGSRPATRAPHADTPPNQTDHLENNYHNHSLVNKVLYVTMSRAVSMYAMLAAYGHHVVRCFGVHPTDRRPQGDVETDPVPETRDNETTETPTGALSARSVVVDNDSQSIKRVLLHTLLFDFCFVLLDLF